MARAMDKVKPATGRIYLADPVNDPTLVRGVGTKFDGPEVQIGGLLVLPTINGEAANAEILEVHGPEEIRLKKGFKGPNALIQLTGREEITVEDGGAGRKGLASDFKGTTYKTAPKVDQTKVYDAVFERLNAGGCVGIFPEGGSHDRTELLPLKGRSRNSFRFAVGEHSDASQSGRGYHGSRSTCSKSRMWLEDHSLRYELFSCTQISVPGCRRIWKSCRSAQ